MTHPSAFAEYFWKFAQFHPGLPSRSKSDNTHPRRGVCAVAVGLTDVGQRSRRGSNGSMSNSSVPSISCAGGLQYAKKLSAELPPNVRPLLSTYIT